MNKVKLERLYLERNLEDYSLKSCEDLFFIHGINVEQIQGYSSLRAAQKKRFKKFIVNFYNAHSLENRDIIPVKVYAALEKSFVIDTKDFINLEIRNVIVNENTRKAESDYRYERFKDREGKLRTAERYIRFEYIQKNERVWLHVNREDSWY